MLSTNKSLLPILLVLAISLCPGIQPAHAQSEMSTVHIEPRVRSSPSNKSGDNSSHTIRTRVALVLVPVTSTLLIYRIAFSLFQPTFQLYTATHPPQIT